MQHRPGLRRRVVLFPNVAMAIVPDAIVGQKEIHHFGNLIFVSGVGLIILSYMFAILVGKIASVARILESPAWSVLPLIWFSR